MEELLTIKKDILIEKSNNSDDLKHLNSKIVDIEALIKRKKKINFQLKSNLSVIKMEYSIISDQIKVLKLTEDILNNKLHKDIEKIANLKRTVSISCKHINIHKKHNNSIPENNDSDFNYLNAIKRHNKSIIKTQPDTSEKKITEMKILSMDNKMKNISKLYKEKMEEISEIQGFIDDLIVRKSLIQEQIAVLNIQLGAVITNKTKNIYQLLNNTLIELIKAITYCDLKCQ